MTLTRVPDRACSGVRLSALSFLFLLLYKGVVALAPASQPLHVTRFLAASRVAFDYKARESLRSDVVHPWLLGALPKHARLPGKGPFVAMLAACQIPKVPTGFGI
jgi:hypothetical protein